MDGWIASVADFSYVWATCLKANSHCSDILIHEAQKPFSLISSRGNLMQEVINSNFEKHFETAVSY